AGMARTSAHLKLLPAGGLRAQSDRRAQRRHLEVDSCDQCSDGSREQIAGRKGSGGRIPQMNHRAIATAGARVKAPGPPAGSFAPPHAVVGIFIVNNTESLKL